MGSEELSPGSADRTLGVDPGGECEIAVGNPAEVVSHKGEPHHPVTNVDIRVMVSLVREDADPGHEAKGLGEGLELELASKRATGKTPAVKLG